MNGHCHQPSQRLHQSNGSGVAYAMNDEHQRDYLQFSKHYCIAPEFRIAYNTMHVELELD